MIKVYKPGEKRKSLSECGFAAQCAEGGGDDNWVTSCVRGTPVCVAVTWAVSAVSPNSSSKGSQDLTMRRHELRRCRAVNRNGL